jgi:sterol desaturase/sphingolipid hydroxylase (fatty acid hydroxylase superfamily)
MVEERQAADVELPKLSVAGVGASVPILAAAFLLLYLAAAFGLMQASRQWPDTVLVSVSDHAVTVARLHEIFFRYSVLGLVVVPAILLLEVLSVGWAASSLRALCRRDNASGRSDLVCFVLVHLRAMRPLQILLTFGFALVSGELVRATIGTWLGLPLDGAVLPLPLHYVGYFLLYTLLDYLAHRVDHSDLFWPIHRFHHAADSFHVVTADRGHPASAFTQSALKVFPMIALGVPLDVMIDLGMLTVAINYLNHSRIDWDFGWFGRHVIQSPRHHRLHHAYGVRESCNLSLCPLWDRLGGTWRDPPEGAIEIGTTELYRHGAFIVPDLLRDYGAFLAGFGRLLLRRGS